MKQIDPKTIPVPEVQRLLQGGIAPRPIALVSTLSADGIPNLSPFSFYNVFGANPPIVVFSPARRGRDASHKDTFNNIQATGECVIQAVSFPMVEQINLASAEFSSEVDEFIKSGLTPLPAVRIKPARVKESPFQMECKVLEIKSYGNGGASANLVICEVILFHVAEDIFEDGVILPDRIDLVSRMGSDFYNRAVSPNVFEIVKPLNKLGIGYENLPYVLKQSDLLSANDLAKLANFEKIPDFDESMQFFESYISSMRPYDHYTKESFFRTLTPFRPEETLSHITFLITRNKKFHNHDYILAAKSFLKANMTEIAWYILIAGKTL
ncbi:MAG: flavin reductase family protein [Ignavibacteriaceae bacterium]|nr:flavin reductase family protein [Ignavibacteriaceae bacterium]